MADQKELKKRLKVLMNKPENQVCSDCTERQPRWASLIVPPPGAPPGSGAIGAFCCLECSGSHRRLGVHISFVRSINLDSWKEKEVIAMENGGNAKVNAIFEARLPQSGAQKPSNHADGPTRERFIRDKYERRKFYDPNAFVEFQQPTQRFEPPANSAPTPVGPPSDAARQRMQDRSRRLHKASSTASDDSNEGSGGGGAGRSSSSRRRPGGASSSSSRNSSSRPQIAKAPVSAPPPSVDLLDFLTPDPAPSHASGQRPTNNDFFGFGGAEVAAPSVAQGGRLPRTRSGEGEHPRRTRSKEDLGSLLDKKATSSSSASEDILSLYHRNSIHSTTSQSTFQSHDNLLNNSQQQRGGYDLGSITSMMGNMNVHQQQQLQHQQPMYGQGGFGMGQMTPQQQQQLLMMQQQYQQQQLMMMQQQQQQQRMMGNNPNAMFQQQMQPQANGNAFGVQQQQSPGYGGFGAAVPMGSGPSMTPMAAGQNQPNSGRRSASKAQPAAPEKEDPFAQFAMNAFR